MPYRDPTPEELKELGVAMATPTSSQSAPFGRQPINTSVIQPRQSPFPTSEEEAQHREDLRLQTSMLPLMAPGSGLVGAAAAGGLNLLTEGANYGIAKLSGHPEEAPSMAGAGGRTALQMALPYGVGKVAEGVAPLTQKLSPMFSAIPKQSQEVLGKVGSAIKTVTRKGLSETTEAKITKDAMLADLEEKGVRLPVGPVVQALKDKFVPYAENEIKGLIKGLEGAAESLDNSISLPKFQELVRAARNQARTPAAKTAFDAFNDEFKTSVAKHISESAQGGPEMAQTFLDTFGETTRRLKIFEKMNKIVGDRQAINITKGMLFDDTAKQALKALDDEAGTQFLPQIEKLAQEASAIERRTAERGATAESNAALISQQKRARAILYGIAGLMGGTATKGVLGGGGGLFGAEIASWLMSRFLGEGGAILPERLAAQTISGVAKATPAAAAAVNQATRDNE